MMGSRSDLSRRIEAHYDRITRFYLGLWGVHIHHGYWEGDEPAAVAQENLVRILAGVAGIARGSRVLDVGCGAGGSAGWLAERLGCSVVGITLSHVQAAIAARGGRGREGREGSGSPPASGERLWFLQADAAALPFGAGAFDAVWMLECFEHLEDKEGIWRGLASVLRPGGRLAVTGWFSAEGVLDPARDPGLAEVMEGMLLPSLVPVSAAARWIEGAGFALGAMRDLTDRVKKTWDVGAEIAARPLVRALLPALDADSRRFVGTFEAMRRAYASGALRYGLIAATLGGDDRGDRSARGLGARG
jgi:tocopherol O-methyltransferase